MDPSKPSDWFTTDARHGMTVACERALKAASGIMWQQLGHLAADGAAPFSRDYFDPARTIVAEYLRHTGRMDEAAEVQAIGCNEPPPPTGFGSLSAAQCAEIRTAFFGPDLP